MSAKRNTNSGKVLIPIFRVCTKCGGKGYERAYLPDLERSISKRPTLRIV